MRLHAPVLTLLLVAAASGTLAQGASDSDARVHALPVAPDVSWTGQQYPAADSKGNVYLLRAKKLEVYPVESDRSLGEPDKLQAAQIETPDPVLDAQMDRHGDWVLVQGTEIRWFPAGKEKPLPALNWMPTAVELRQGRPIAAVVPFAFGRPPGARGHGVPFLLSAGTHEWSTLVASDLDEPADARSMVPIHDHAGHLSTAADGEICFAHLYRYHFECFTPGGRKHLEVTVEGGKVAHRVADDEALEAARIELEEARARTSNPERVKIVANKGIKSILDLTEGPDGLYLLVNNPEGEGLVLDRFNTVTQTLERVEIAGAHAKGAMSMVAGKGGLYLAAFNGASGRWMIPWQRLAEVSWAPVDGVEIDQ